ncbi:glycosyltransferase family A protein [Ruania halotolerans]|uniref:glycosyltransferase family A protein n=1 Tax=Ruania halotolerans TaxID=2897773 RepID=UPI001E5B0B5B|nr:glycosyltransferase family A protein [Ruania halotolerans]UFU07551.1 glycosyltransferase family 2 protein [Ruania halotolerans]
MTVVMPCYRPDSGLITSVRSIIAQSYENLQIVLVDDASGPGYEQMFDRCRQMDDRVEVHHAEHNGGTYAARNQGLSVSRGELITFQDADDWSHPERIERQVAKLRTHRRAAGSISDAIRAKDDLTHQWLGYRPRRRNASSLMIRRTVVESIGGFDMVRKSADSEYYERVKAAAGPVLDVDEPLAVTRLRAGTLSRADFRYQWLAHDRMIYRDNFRYWHATAGSPLRIDPGTDRAFPAPRTFQQPRSTLEPRRIPVLVVADLSDPRFEQPIATAVDRMVSQGAEPALLHRENALLGRSRRPDVLESYMGMAAAGTVEMVADNEPLDVGLVVLIDPNILASAHRPAAEVRCDEVVGVLSVPTTLDDIVDHLVVADECVTSFGRAPRWVASSHDSRTALEIDGFSDLQLFDDVLDACADLGRTNTDE